MAAYISLIKHTHQGISSLKEGLERLGANRELLVRDRRGAEGVLPHHGEDQCLAG